ncbi:conserved uncharacterized protein [Candidatus Vecturithrix granuli]|uniref:Conserved uncharacterized protein n=1 Tax=Vecturithrix granuli TaxID=1499967 RepID=A0A081BWZ3_VECG1|nr:conserved uncharacterized protein [Candidatus Vecturithrix granuli]
MVLKNSPAYHQAELLLRILPLINVESVFALKGGTAINFFVRDLPRLSIDIDLAYLPLTNRQTAIDEISQTLQNITEKIIRTLPGSIIVSKTIENTAFLKGMIVKWEDAVVKIEPNLVIRGSVFAPEMKLLTAQAQTLFELSMSVRTLASAELYAGKVCAALDRQHPRDWFDIWLMLRCEGFYEMLRKAFLVYLISHPRPIIELLNPKFQPISDTLYHEFKAITREPFEYKELLNARAELVRIIKQSLTEKERRFLASFKQAEPDWNLLGLEHIQNLPAVQWKLFNIRQMTPQKRQQAVVKLRQYLEI